MKKYIGLEVMQEGWSLRVWEGPLFFPTTS